MPRWKSTQNILKDYLEVFDENWMNYDRISQYAPPSPEWTGDRPMRVEDVDIWEVVTEMSGPIGVYAAWCPYGELYVVTNRGRIEQEFSGWKANERLERYLVQNGIPYPKCDTSPKEDHFSQRLILV